jgi:hypothetical protein
MNKEEKMEKLEHMQMYFVKSFLVSFVFLLLATIMCLVMHDFQVAFVQKYFPMALVDINLAIILLLGLWKILIIQFTLIPALVLWGMKKCCHKSK